MKKICGGQSFVDGLIQRYFAGKDKKCTGKKLTVFILIVVSICTLLTGILYNFYSSAILRNDFADILEKTTIFGIQSGTMLIMHKTAVMIISLSDVVLTVISWICFKKKKHLATVLRISTSFVCIMDLLFILLMLSDSRTFDYTIGVVNLLANILSAVCTGFCACCAFKTDCITEYSKSCSDKDNP